MNEDAPSGDCQPGAPPWEVDQQHEFERAKASFDQNFQQFRHLNHQMNKLPAFAVTLTGGFWYIAVVVATYGHGLSPLSEHLARWGIMIFAGICDLALVCIAIRIRDVMGDYLNRVRRFEGEWWTEATPSLPWFKNYSMISMYSVLILAGALLSFVGSFVLFWPSDALPLWTGILIVVCALAFTMVVAFRMPRWLAS